MLRRCSSVIAISSSPWFATTTVCVSSALSFAVVPNLASCRLSSSSSSSSSKFELQDIDTSKLNHMYWDDDVLLPYLLGMMDELGVGGDSLSYVPDEDASLLRRERLEKVI